MFYHCTDQFVNSLRDLFTCISCSIDIFFCPQTNLALSALKINHSKSLILTVFHICFIGEQSKFIQIWRTCIWTETLTVSTFIAHRIHMKDLVHLHIRNLNGNVFTVHRPHRIQDSEFPLVFRSPLPKYPVFWQSLPLLQDHQNLLQVLFL